MATRLRIAALIVFGVAAALVIFEIGLRIANLWFPYFFSYDPDRGWGLRPNTSRWYNREGEAFVQINSDGFREKPYAKRKRADTVRVAMLGDSYTEAIQVLADKTFCSVAGQALARCPALKGRRVEALNFGVDGYGTAQELITLQRKVWPYSPDIVVLAVFLGNDIRNNSVTLEGDQCRPFYVYRDNRLVPAGPFFDSKAFRLWCMTRFSYRDMQLLGLFDNAWTILWERPQSPTSQHPIERAINYNIYKPPADQAWRDAWQVTEGLITEMRNEVASHGASFVVVTLDTGIQVWPKPQVRENFERYLGVNDLFYPDRRIAELGRREGFAVLTLSEPLQRYAEQHDAFLHGFKNTPMGFGHWNAEGHRVAGDLIAQKLCEMIESGKCRSCTEGLPKAAPMARASDSRVDALPPGAPLVGAKPAAHSPP
jgi:hypothetical protein